MSKENNKSGPRSEERETDTVPAKRDPESGAKVEQTKGKKVNLC